MTTLRLFASAVLAATFIAPGKTSGSNFTPRADQPVKLAQNRCTSDHQRLCRQHHEECKKNPVRRCMAVAYLTPRVSLENFVQA